MLKRYGSIQYAYDAAAAHAEAAREAICSFADSEIKRALLAIPEFVVERSS
jgi:geranylgeranyl pyrophosphate synthase